MTIQPEIATLEQLIKDTQETLNKAQSDLKNYQELVKTGHLTLGSPLEDFIFVHHIDNREHWRNFYTKLSELCIEDTPIMFEHSGTTSQLRRTSWGRPNEYSSAIYHNNDLGILTGKMEFNVEKGYVVFPTDFYVTTRIMERPQKTNSPIHVYAASFKDYGKYVPYVRVEGDISAIPQEHSMKIIFGSRDEYLRRKAEYAQNQDNQNQDYASLFEQKRLVGPYDKNTNQLRLTSS